MFQWLKHKKEERHLKRCLHLALDDAFIQQLLKIEQASFSLAKDVMKIVPEASEHDRVLVGTYKEWPKIKRAPADCVLELGTFLHQQNAAWVPQLKISAVIYSSRVVGFLFGSLASSDASFPDDDKDLKFQHNLELESLSGSSNQVPNPDFPKWLPWDSVSKQDVDLSYALPAGYHHEQTHELFRWFRSLQGKEYLFERPSSHDELEINGEVYLPIAYDDAGNMLALTRQHPSRLVRCEHSSSRVGVEIVEMRLDELLKES